MNASVVRIATRGSALALHQARLVAAALAERGVASELVTYTTVGDRRLDQPLSAIGAKGLFTEELERDLLAGTVDCCVNSLKDLPTAMPPGLAIVAQLPREDPRDALVLGPALAALATGGGNSHAADGAALVRALPAGARVGTSSLRRRAQLLALRPDLEVRDLRGNVPTRLRKIADGEVDAAILAAAGLHRLGEGARIAAYLSHPAWLPAAGQGSIAVQARAGDEALGAILASLDDAATTLATTAERAFLAALEGGCQVPIAALAVRGADSAWRLHGLVADLSGAVVIRGSLAADPADPAASGRELAASLQQRGAGDLLGAIRAATNLPAPQPE
ncbi:MAG: hydroxymethylbilane synthase [Gemmatimonadaceae bacterium]